jgi:hypothetical protein
MGAIVGTTAESVVAATKAAAAVFVVGLWPRRFLAGSESVSAIKTDEECDPKQSQRIPRRYLHWSRVAGLP